MPLILAIIVTWIRPVVAAAGGTTPFTMTSVAGHPLVAVAGYMAGSLCSLGKPNLLPIPPQTAERLPSHESLAVLGQMYDGERKGMRQQST